jgi:hypothetical protein
LPSVSAARIAITRPTVRHHLGVRKVAIANTTTLKAEAIQARTVAPVTLADLGATTRRSVEGPTVPVGRVEDNVARTTSRFVAKCGGVHVRSVSTLVAVGAVTDVAAGLTMNDFATT